MSHKSNSISQSIRYINSKSTSYLGVAILSVFVFLNEMYRTNQTWQKTSTSIVGIALIIVFLYSVFKIMFGRHKVQLTEAEFKVIGHEWISWSELVSVYPYDELDSENGTRSYLRFRLIDGTDLSVRSENLEMSFEQVAELVELYKDNFRSIKAQNGA